MLSVICIIIIIQLLLLNTGLVYHFCKINFLFFKWKKVICNAAIINYYFLYLRYEKKNLLIVMFSKSDIKDNNGNNRVLNKSQWLAKFAGYFIGTHCLLFFGNDPPKSHNLMIFVFCLNTPIFCTRMLKKLCTLIRGPDFKFFPGGPP